MSNNYEVQGGFGGYVKGEHKDRDSRLKVLQAVEAITSRFENGERAVYEEANDLIESLGGKPLVTLDTDAVSAFCYIQALTIRYLLEPTSKG